MLFEYIRQAISPGCSLSSPSAGAAVTVEFCGTIAIRVPEFPSALGQKESTQLKSPAELALLQESSYEGAAYHN